MGDLVGVVVDSETGEAFAVPLTVDVVAELMLAAVSS